MTLIEMAGIWKSFDDSPALIEAGLVLEAGEIHGLLGENGAGKTTLCNVLAGIYRPDAGAIRIDGEAVSLRSPRQALRCGVGMVHQHFRLVDPLTVAENIHLGWGETPRRLSPQSLARRTAAASEQFGLAVDPSARVWQLSVGEQQRVEILRVLVHGARVLILDEPTAVLTPGESRDLFAVLRRLAESGRTVVFISHKLPEVLALTDRVTVLRRGRHVATCQTSSVDASALAGLMTGGERAQTLERTHSEPGRPVVKLAGITARSDRGIEALKQATLTVHAGEIVGVAGVSGNGQRELTEVLTGLRRPEAGTVEINGVDLTGRSARDFAAAGVGHVPEDRIGMAIVQSATVEDNAIMRTYRGSTLRTRLVTQRGKGRSYAKRMVSEARVEVADVHVPIAHLSGGNQQRLVARREAWSSGCMLVAAQPTRGLDFKAAGEVRQLLLDRRAEGCAVLMVSDDLDEILAMSDRVVVMYDGQIAGAFPVESANRQEVGFLMGGGHLRAHASAGEVA